MLGNSSTPGGRIPPIPGVSNQEGEHLLKRESSGSKGVFIDWGPDIPTFYAVDRLRAFIRDPFWICLHWYLEGTRSNRWRKKLNAEPKFYLILEGTDSSRFEYRIERECPFLWISVKPGKAYSARIIIRTEGKTIEICRSKEFTTPEPWVKAPRENIPEFVRESLATFGYSLDMDSCIQRAKEGFVLDKEAAAELMKTSFAGYALPSSFEGYPQ